MGYRSDVKIVFYLTHPIHDTTDTTDTPPTNPVLTFPALKLWFDETYPVKEAKEEWEAEIEYGSNYILCSYQDVKWYEGYQHPNNVSNAFEKFSAAFRSDERDHRAQYEFVRIGEEYDDIQLDSSSYSDHRIAIARSMICE